MLKFDIILGGCGKKLNTNNSDHFIIVIMKMP